MRRCLALAVLGLLSWLPPRVALAQFVTPPESSATQSSVLTVDPEALFSQSKFGQRVLQDLQTETEALAAQNRDLAASLTAEEQDLASRRPSMDPAAFRSEAEAFDARVQDIRAARDAKESALQDSVTAGRDTFFAAAAPILRQIMSDRGATVLLDRRTVVISAGVVDITEAAIGAVDTALGDGIAEPAQVPAPDGGN